MTRHRSEKSNDEGAAQDVEPRDFLDALVVQSQLQRRGSPAPTEQKEPGTAGAFFLAREPTWVRRHVETVEYLGRRRGVRRLTVDLVLPAEPDAWLGFDGRQAKYCIPVSRLPKTPTAYIDLRDGEDNALSLITSAESAEISAQALAVAVGEVVDLAHKRNRALVLAIPALASGQDRSETAFWWSVWRQAARDSGLTDHSSWDRLARAARLLKSNSFIWLTLEGEPGSRHLVKLAYRIEMHPPRVPARMTIRGPLGTGEGRGAIKKRATLQNLKKRTSSALGWNPIDLYVDGPLVRDADSYHFQLRLEPEFVVQNMEAIGDTGETVPSGQYLADAHLYLRNPKTRVRQIKLGLRVEPRGFLNTALTTAAAICALLWLFAAHVDAVSTDTEKQIAAAVLVIVPASLVVFATRAGEHALASSMLAGVRFLMLISGLGAVVAAAALADVRVAGLETTWAASAAVASVCLAGIGIAWAMSLMPVVRRAARIHAWWIDETRRAREFGWPWALALLAVALSALVWTDAFELQDHGAIVAAIAGALLAASVALSLHGACRPSGARCLLRSLAVVLLVLGLAALVDAAPVRQETATPLAMVLAFGLLVSAGTTLLNVHLDAEERKVRAADADDEGDEF